MKKSIRNKNAFICECYKYFGKPRVIENGAAFKFLTSEMKKAEIIVDHERFSYYVTDLQGKTIRIKMGLFLATDHVDFIRRVALSNGIIPGNN